MTKQINRFKFGAVTATASLAAGIAALAFAIKLETDPLTLTTRPPAPQPFASVTETNGWTAPLAEAMFNDAHAVPSVGSRASQAWVRTVAQVTPAETNCVERWENLEMGPVGRHYSVLCRDEPILALPPPNARARAATKIELPTPTELAVGIEGTPLDLQPSSQNATQAGRTVDRRVSTASERAEAKHPTYLPDHAYAIPYVDPLGWSISNKALEKSES